MDRSPCFEQRGTDMIVLIKGKDYYDYELLEGEGGEPDKIVIQFTPVFLKMLKSTPTPLQELPSPLHKFPCRSSESSRRAQVPLPDGQESEKPPPAQ